ncbi:74_t:CDS:2, partial [Dentiscutata erythropus]
MDPAWTYFKKLGHVLGFKQKRQQARTHNKSCPNMTPEQKKICFQQTKSKKFTKSKTVNLPTKTSTNIESFGDRISKIELNNYEVESAKSLDESFNSTDEIEDCYNIETFSDSNDENYTSTDEDGDFIVLESESEDEGDRSDEENRVESNEEDKSNEQNRSDEESKKERNRDYEESINSSLKITEIENVNRTELNVAKPSEMDDPYRIFVMMSDIVIEMEEPKSYKCKAFKPAEIGDPSF